MDIEHSYGSMQKDHNSTVLAMELPLFTLSHQFDLGLIWFQSNDDG